LIESGSIVQEHEDEFINRWNQHVTQWGTNISNFSFWLLVENKEYFVPF